MACSFYGKTCSIGGTYCKEKGEEAEKNCSEAAELHRIEVLPCPILKALNYKDSISRCDQPLIVRVTLIRSAGNCCRENACQIVEVLPGKRAELSQGLPGSKPISVDGLAPTIKAEIRMKKIVQGLRPATSA